MPSKPILTIPILLVVSACLILVVGCADFSNNQSNDVTGTSGNIGASSAGDGTGASGSVNGTGASGSVDSTGDSGSVDNEHYADIIENDYDTTKCEDEGYGVRIANMLFSDYDTPIYTIHAVAYFGADNTGKSDSAPAIQNALNCAASQWGGIVYLPQGRYLIQKALDIPEGITLRGDWKRPTDADKKVEGTVLYIDFGQGNSNGNAITLHGNAAQIRDLSIYYPQQSVNSPKEYPYTIGSSGSFSMVRNVTLVNSYQGIHFEPERTESIGFPNAISVYGAPLHRGLLVDRTAATPRFQNLNFAPEYWSESGLDNVTASSVKSAMRQVEGIGISSGDGDGGGNYAGIRISGYDIGWDMFDQQSARVFDFEITDCRIGLNMSYTKEHGWVFTRGLIQAEEIAMRLYGSFLNSQFNDIVFSSDGELINHEIGTAGFTKCTFEKWGTGYAINTSAGWLAVAGCNFKQQNAHIELKQNVDRALIFSNKGAGGSVDIKNNSPASSDYIVIDNITQHDFIEADKIDYLPSRHNQIPRPGGGTSHVFNVRDYGALGDSKNDDTNAIQMALDAAGELATSKSGTVVFVPTGVYRIDGHLNVPQFVELRGINDSAFSEAARSILASFADRDNPKGQAFITLEADSGIKGFFIYRPEQRWKPGDMTLHEYPPAIRGTDRNWAYNLSLGNTYDGIDFSTGGGHSLEFILGNSLNNVVQLRADGAPSYLNNFQVKTEFWRKAAKINLPTWEESGFGEGAPTVEEGRSADEYGTGVVLHGNGTFFFLSHFVNTTGDSLYKVYGSPTANFYMVGGEGDGTGFYIYSDDSADMDLEMVGNSYHTGGEAFTVSETSAGDKIHIINCKNYGGAPINHILRGTSQIVLQQEYRGGLHDISLQLEDKSTGIIESGFFDGGTSLSRITALNESQALMVGTMTNKDKWEFNSSYEKNISVKSVCPTRLDSISGDGGSL